MLSVQYFSTGSKSFLNSLGFTYTQQQYRSMQRLSAFRTGIPSLWKKGQMMEKCVQLPEIWAMSGGTRTPHSMMTSSNGNIFRVTGPLCGEFTGPGEFPTQRPVTQSFDVLFDLGLNKPLSKQLWGWRFETPSRSLWCHCNDLTYYGFMMTSSNGNIFSVTGPLCGNSPLNSDHKGQWCRALMFSLIWNIYLSKRSWGLWFHHAHYDVTVMLVMPYDDIDLGQH